MNTQQKFQNNLEFFHYNDLELKLKQDKKYPTPILINNPKVVRRSNKKILKEETIF
ncbi:unnamed protein product [Paramecium pentaurelia]|uniref:Uncharacterized protein n=1 Tax=Paramecium pentaurelia TaxID=43138 RepID=A0A8S1UZ06_9CILI|nr:unnamed protein product [Paramecium pentaurelia]